MTPAVDSTDVERFRGIVTARLGLQFEDSRLGFLAEVLRSRLSAAHDEAAAYLSRLERNAALDGEEQSLARDLTVGETYFFRNIGQFHAFGEVALRARMAERRAERTLRVLSAGCASGEEPYTLAMLLKDALRDPSWKVEIRAVDVNPAAIERAADARYGAWALRETPAAMLERWFRPAGRDFVLDEEIRAAVTFETRNLAADDPDLWRSGYYDTVFCRNVIMYFSVETMRAVVQRIATSLVPGGYLFLGHAETLRGLSQDFHLLHSHDTFYYRTRGVGEAPPAPSIPLATEFPARAAPRSPPPAPETSTEWMDTIAAASERIRALGAPPPSLVPSLIAAAPKWNRARVLDLVQLERFSEALALVRAMPEEASQDSDVLLLTAVLLAHSGQMAAAAEVATRLLAGDEMSAGAHYVLALSCEGLGDRAAAAKHDNFAVYLDPEFAMPRLHLGLLAKRAGDVAAARRELSQALLLLEREDASRLLLFGGGFTRAGLVALCRTELAKTEGRA
jgi:chemotaxis protein methyltransferase CheR